MSTYEVAHIREQGVDLIIVALSSSFGHMSDTEQERIIGGLQIHANQAGLRGTVVPVWDSGFGRMGFRAPLPWHSFFKSINLRFVALNINRKLICN
jgi:hypothetical protein